MSTNKIKVLIAPKDDNPYQKLLYGNMAELEVAYVMPSRFSFLTWPKQLLIRRAQGYEVLHIHWLFFLKFPKSFYISKVLTGINNRLFLMVSKILGYKIVWTVHNLLPHEQQSLNDAAITRKLIDSSAANIVHSEQTILDMKRLGFSTTKSSVIPIGTYESLYSDNISRASARKQLKITNKEVVILFFGIVREYKGLDDLLIAFKSIQEKNLRLIIAGKCDDPQLARQISLMSNNLNVNFVNSFIPDNQVALYFKACDIVCLPFKQITTSSSVLLAMSFKKVVIAPELGAIASMPKNALIFYDRQSQNGLVNAIKWAINEPLKTKRIASSGLEYSKSLGWDKIGEKTRHLYSSLID